MALADNTIPTIHNCDLTDPEEMFLPFLVGIPGMKGAPLPFPIKYLRQVSRRIHEASGATPDLSKAKIKWEAPARTGIEGAHWFTNPGKFVPFDKPEVKPKDHVDTVVDGMNHTDRVAIAKSLERYGITLPDEEVTPDDGS